MWTRIDIKENKGTHSTPRLCLFYGSHVHCNELIVIYGFIFFCLVQNHQVWCVVVDGVVILEIKKFR